MQVWFRFQTLDRVLPFSCTCSVATVISSDIIKADVTVLFCDLSRATPLAPLSAMSCTDCCAMQLCQSTDSFAKQGLGAHMSGNGKRKKMQSAHEAPWIAN